MNNMANQLSRREFLRLSGCGLGSLALRPILGRMQGGENARFAVRVAVAQVNVRHRPDFKSEIVSVRRRDEILAVFEQVQAAGSRNPDWFRVPGGYVYSASVQPVSYSLNRPLSSVPESGIPAEVTVPFTSSMIIDRRTGRWDPGYRLYYSSVHWVTGSERGPGGEIWYRIQDAYDRLYYALAAHLRPIPDEELSPISPEMAPADKYIKVSIGEQLLRAYEKDKLVLETRVSTGVPQKEAVEPGQFSTDTPLGDFHITVKTPSRHMGDKHITADYTAPIYPGVPWVCFFHKDGYSLHGTYWHSNYGYRMSHGCVNMRPEDALWIYRWTQPAVPPGQSWHSEWGTRVSIV